ncbi:MAG: PAS domain-containing protein [Muribaculaceae bacterium]|nr:PAS domain-containing protein [Muribaculaceae bacterium]
MRSSFSFLVLSLSFLTLVVFAIIGDISYWVWFIPVGVGIMATLTLFRGIFIPQKAVEHGLELIQSQDYNNRLVKVGEPHADKIVSLFNSLIDKLRSERLQNREQESLLKLLIEASPMGVVMLDFDNRISMINPSFLRFFGIKEEEEILGRTISEIENDLIPEILNVPLGKSEINRKSNYRIYRVYHLNFVQEGFKREFFLLESLTDEIMKAEKVAYEKVIRTISHEVNNTIGGVKSVLETVSESTLDHDIKKVVESCSRRCEVMSNFIREYAEVVKLPELMLKKIDLCKEIELMIPFFQSILPGNVDLIYQPPKNSAFINADSGLLQQVLINIVKNAFESIKIKGYIEIRVSAPDHRKVLLIVSNNGSPIEKKVETQLFTPFFTTKTNGKGIGLTLIRDILTRHSAEYSLSTGEDGITNFVIIFDQV